VANLSFSLMFKYFHFDGRQVKYLTPFITCGSFIAQGSTACFAFGNRMNDLRIGLFRHFKDVSFMSLLTAYRFTTRLVHILFNIGTRLKSIAVYLNQYQLVPFGRLRETFVDLFNHRLSQSTLVDANLAFCNTLEPVGKAIKQRIIASPVICLDKTGIRIEGGENGSM